MQEQSLIIIKPDAIQRGLVGEITHRFEKKGLKLIGMKMMTLSQLMLKQHYAHIADKPFFGDISHFMQSSPVIVQCWEGLEAVNAIRIICGITKAREADSGSIRGDLAMSIQCNVVHASDSVENAKKELKHFFGDGELFDYDKAEYVFVYSDDERKEMGK